MKEKVVFYVHGKNGSKEELERLKPLLQERGYDGYAIDLPGHGQSTEDLVSFYSMGYQSSITNLLWNAFKGLCPCHASCKQHWRIFLHACLARSSYRESFIRLSYTFHGTAYNRYDRLGRYY